MAKKREPADRAIVMRFVAHLVEHGYPDLQVDHWLEDVYPGQSVVEAIAGPFAIEHTSVDTLPNQRGLGDQFQKALGALELLPVTARLRLVVPYELVQVGGDWNSYLLALAHWTLVTAPGLPDGTHTIPILGTGLECVVDKDSVRPAGILLSRPAPHDDTLPARVGEQIGKKMEKLARYKREGHSTVLIVETRDSALMNQHKMLDAMRTAMGGKMPEGLDHLWYSEAAGHVFFDFTGPITDGHDIIV